MPRRTSADALSLAIGARIRQLREEAGLTIEGLAYSSELGSKGHLSSIERGLVRPTAHTLEALAEGLDALLVDIVNFPEAGDRQRLIELTRRLPASRLKPLLREVETSIGRQGVLKAAEGGVRYRPHRRPARKEMSRPRPNS